MSCMREDKCLPFLLFSVVVRIWRVFYEMGRILILLFLHLRNIHHDPADPSIEPGTRDTEAIQVT